MEDSSQSRSSSDGRAALAEMLLTSSRTVALTGAGISVPSGIPDFRSPGTGFWESVDPMEVAHIDAFHRDAERFWAFYSARFAILDDKQPNGAHLALAELERRGLVEAVVTQNIDMLHRRAGSRRVVEVHGSVETSSCLECPETVPLEDVRGMAATDGVPRCSICGRPLKPDVVLFGEMLPEAAIREAYSLAATADLLLCIGSSLTVHPVAGLPDLTRANGGDVAILTRGETPCDGMARLRLDGDVVIELEGVLDHLPAA